MSLSRTGRRPRALSLLGSTATDRTLTLDDGMVNVVGMTVIVVGTSEPREIRVTDQDQRVATVAASPHFTVGPLNRRIFGSFVEHMGRCVYTGIFEPEHPTADQQG